MEGWSRADCEERIMLEEEGTLDELLESIEKGFGPYSRDHLTHASNVIDSSKKKAKKVRSELIATLLPLIREAENGEVVDVKFGLYELLIDLGVEVKKDEFGDYYIEEDSK